MNDHGTLEERGQRRGEKSTKLALPKRCRLLELPAELRNAIYEMVLIQPDPIRVKFKTRRIKLTVRSIIYSISFPPLVASCQAVREETVKMFFSANVFTFSVPAYLATAPLAFSNLTPHIRLMKQIKLEIGHKYLCGNDHIYKIDITGGTSTQRIKWEISEWVWPAPQRYPEYADYAAIYQSGEDCSDAKVWYDRLAHEIDAIATRRGDDTELQAGDIARCFRVLRYKGFS